jgi:hypothetical protein
MSCEDQALVPTNVCLKTGCDKAVLVLKSTFWCCPVCHVSYREHAKSGLAISVPINPDDYHNPKPSPYDWSTRDEVCTERGIAENTDPNRLAAKIVLNCLSDDITEAFVPSSYAWTALQSMVNKARNDPGISIRATLREVYATILESEAKQSHSYAIQDTVNHLNTVIRQRNEQVAAVDKELSAIKKVLASKERLVESQQQVITELYNKLHPKPEKTFPLASYPRLHADWRGIVEVEKGEE